MPVSGTSVAKGLGWAQGEICWSPSTHWTQSAPAELQRDLAVQVKRKETHCITAAIPCWWMQIATASWVDLALSTPGLWVPAYLMHFLLRLCVLEAFMWPFQYSLQDILCLPKYPGWGDWDLHTGCSELWLKLQQCQDFSGLQVFSSLNTDGKPSWKDMAHSVRSAWVSGWSFLNCVVHNVKRKGQINISKLKILLKSTASLLFGFPWPKTNMQPDFLLIIFNLPGAQGNRIPGAYFHLFLY